MSKDFELEIGKTYYPPVRDLIVTDTHVRGQGWQIEKIGDSFIFGFIAARHGGGEERYVVSEEDFALAKRGKVNYQDLINKYDSGNS